jgi:hypothetical protein
MRKTIQTRIKEYRNYLIYKINHSNENLKDHDTATLIARKQEDEVWIKSGYEQLLGVRCASEVIYEDFENIFKNPKNTNPLENL